jgi:hypothetical protein
MINDMNDMTATLRPTRGRILKQSGTWKHVRSRNKVAVIPDIEIGV